MPLRVASVGASLLVHVLVFNLVWGRLETERADALQLGLAQDIFVEPLGVALEEALGSGADVETVETEQEVSLRQDLPALAALAPVLQASDVMTDLTPTVTDSGIAAYAGETLALGPPEISSASAAPVASATASVALNATSIAAENSQHQPAVALPDQLHDVLASEVSHIADSFDRTSNPLMPDAVATDGTVSERSLVQPAPIAGQHLTAPPDEAEADFTLVEEDSVRQPAPMEQVSAAPVRPIEQSNGDAAEIVQTEMPSPVQPVERDTLELIEVVAEPDDVVMSSEQGSGIQLSGGDATAVGLYLGEVNAKVQRAKVNPRSTSTGTVVLRFTIGIDGALLLREVAASSGVRVLDEAAVSSIEQAAPFPPLPLEFVQPLTLTQHFRYLVR